MRSYTITAVALAATLITSSALAQDKVKGAKSSKKTAPTLVASAEPLPALPTPEPTPAPAAPAPVAPAPVAEKDAPNAASTETTSTAPSLHLSFGSGVGVFGGDMADGYGVGAVMATANVRVGGYVTPHIGLVSGFQIGGGAFTAGCDGCKGIAYHLPVVAQYAFTDRSRGAYVEGGLALFSTLSGSGDVNGVSFSQKLSTPIDLKFGIGYRFAPEAKMDKAAAAGFDLRFNLDVGDYKSMAVAIGDTSAEADIAESRRSTHYVMGLSLGYNFTP
jgi:hypothetical protein